MDYRRLLVPGKKKRKTVCIVGAGGLGSSASAIMACEDSLDLVLIDDDVIEESNLQRQVLFTEDDVGKSKVSVAKERLLDINPGMDIRAVQSRLDARCQELLKSDLILDCTDNLETRHLINRFAYEKNIPWVYCSVAGSHGYAKAMTRETACLECFLKHPDRPESLETSGMLNSLVQLASAVQCRLALDILAGKRPDDVLLHFDAWSLEMTRVLTKKKQGCAVCGR